VIRSGYSFRTAIGHTDAVIARLQEIGWTTAPIADRLSTYGFNRWTKAAKKAGLRPIYGVELPVDGNPWRFLATTSLRPLHQLLYDCTDKERPGLTFNQAISAQGLIKIAGHRLRLDGTLPSEDFFIGLSPALPAGLFRAAERMGHQFIAVSDNVYPNAADRELYRVALGKRAETQSYPQHILSDDEWHATVSWFALTQAKSAIANREAVFNRCQAQMKHGTLLKPQINMTLREMCLAGAQRTGTNLQDPVYHERLERELSLIAEKKFEDYFFILSDIINFAKEHMIVGPARGSSCGSLVCYLLNITAVDPIPFGLIFERFIDINRTDLPDIDVDFSDEKRWMVFDYAAQKYGQDRVARLGTVLLFRPKSALNQAGIALRIPKWEVEKVLDTVIERSSGDSRAMQALEDTFNDTETGREFIGKYPEARIMAPMEGHPVTAGQHAAGIIITQDPIIEYVAVDARTGSAMCDKKDSEDLNLLKIDALGLTQLSVFEHTLEQLGIPPKSGWLEQVPLNDQAAFDVLNKGQFAGIFQFNGSVLQNVTGQIGKSSHPVNHINDIVQITAVARPGPAASGGTLAWVRRRTGLDKVETLHPLLTELTKETYGVNLFQETTMQVVRELGNFSWEDTSAIRKAMSGRLGNEFFARYKANFLVGAASNGIEEATAVKIWDSIATMGSWQMNKSHCVAYGLVSYYCAYLKAHHPLEFAAATLDSETEPSRQIAILRELKAEGIGYKAIDPERSTDRWTVQGDMLLGPLTSVKGIGPAAVKEIVAARKTNTPLRPALAKLLEHPVTDIDSLYPIADAITRLLPTSGLKLKSTPLKCAEIQTGIHGDVVVLGLAERLATLDENEPIRVMRRGGRIYPPPTDALNIFLRDDTEQLLCRIDRTMFPSIGKDVVEYGRPGKAMYALKGFVPSSFRMLIVKRIFHLGDIDG
jgi:DNA-directed DNA polymerase III PolC